MSDSLFCRLYIATDRPIEEVQVVAEALASPGVAALVYRNEVFEESAAANHSTDFIAISRLTAEVDGYELDLGSASETFQAAVVGLVRELRCRGYGVVAACDFEDRIASETGWNWSTANPLPPRS